MWYGGGHLHKECPEKVNLAAIPTCCNFKLAISGRVFAFTTTTIGLSFAAALSSNAAIAEVPFIPGFTGLRLLP
jgi:hypothetical protein